MNMEIVKYDEDDHAGYLPDHHPPKYRDGDIEKFKPVAEEALTELKDFTEFEDDIELILGVTDVEELGADSPKGYYFMGFSFSEDLHDYPGNAVCMRASDSLMNGRKHSKACSFMNWDIRFSTSEMWIGKMISIIASCSKVTLKIWPELSAREMAEAFHPSGGKKNQWVLTNKSYILTWKNHVASIMKTTTCFFKAAIDGAMQKDTQLRIN